MQADKNTKSILLFGGQFDPVHIEHLQILKAAIAECQPTLVKVVLSYQQKTKSKAFACFSARVEMLKRALAEWKIVAEVDTIESQLQGNGYSVELLQAIKEGYPDYKLYFLMGADQFLHFDNWYMPQKITQLATLVIASRVPNCITERQIVEFQRQYCTTVHLCKYVGKDISSTDIQCKLVFDKSVEESLPRSVNSYIPVS